MTKKFTLTREQVKELCPSCAEQMEKANLKLLKLSLDDDGGLVPGDKLTLKLFAGFSQGMCDKFGPEMGMFTRCAAAMSGKVDDEKAFCASLHEYCTGKWPAEKHALEAEAAAYSNSIKGVEIFAVGTHNGDTYTEADLDAMVAAHRELDFRPAVKVGHTKDKPGAPAYGWVANLRRAGTKLLADFTDLHDSVVDAIRQKQYDNVSSEIYFNLKRGGKTFHRALKAVALLGAEVPAVANLVPLHKMEFAAEGEFEKIFATETKLDVSAQALFDCLSERMASLIQSFSSSEGDMKTRAQQLKELNEKLTEATVKLEALSGATDKDKDAQVKVLKADIAAISEQLKTLAAATDDDRSEAEKAEAELVKAELKAATDQIAELQADGRRRSVAERLATVKVPAFRPAMEALYSYALLHTAEKVKVYTKDKDGKETSADKTLLELVDDFAGQINGQAEKLFKALSYAGSPQREEGSDDAGGDPGAEVDKRTRTWAREKSVSYSVAMEAVLEADPELKRRYAEQTKTHAQAH